MISEPVHYLPSVLQGRRLTASDHPTALCGNDIFCTNSMTLTINPTRVTCNNCMIIISDEFNVGFPSTKPHDS